MKRAALLLLLACRCTLIVDGLVDHADSGGTGGGSTGGGGGALGGGTGGGALGGGAGGGALGGGSGGGGGASNDGGTDAGIDGGSDAGIPRCGPTNPMLGCREVTRGYGNFYYEMSLAANDDSLYLALPVVDFTTHIELVRYSPLDGGVSTQLIDAGSVSEMNVAAEGTRWALAWSESAMLNVNVFCTTDSASTITFALTNESLYFMSPAISASGNVLLGAGPSYAEGIKYIYGQVGDGGCPTSLAPISIPHGLYGGAAFHRPNTGDEGFELIDTGTDSTGSTVDVTTLSGDGGQVSYSYSTGLGAGLFSAALLSDGGFVLAVTDPGAAYDDPYLGEPGPGGTFSTTNTMIQTGVYASNVSSCGPDGCIAVPYSLNDTNDDHFNDGVLSVAISHAPPPAAFTSYDVTCDAGVSAVASAFLGGKLYVAYTDLSSVYVVYECPVP